MEGVEWLSLSHCFRLEAWGFLNICRADLSVVDPDFCGSLGKGFQQLRVWELAAPGAFGFDWGFTIYIYIYIIIIYIYIYISGQIIATSHDLTPKGS